MVERDAIPSMMRSIRLHGRGLAGLRFEEIETPRPRAGEALVRVHAAAITRGELEWPVDRLPAIPSYEFSGIVGAVAPDVASVAVGEPVYALTPFDRDGVAAAYAAVPASVLAPKPPTLSHIESAAVPLAALSAWQGLFDHGRLEEGERVLVLGPAGGVGHFATQLARRRGAHVIAMTSASRGDSALELGAHEALDPSRLEAAVASANLVFDTAGGDLLTRSAEALRDGRLVSVAEDVPAATYFVVEPNRAQLLELARLADSGELRPEIDSVFPLEEASAAFARVAERRKRGKVVLRVADD